MVNRLPVGYVNGNNEVLGVLPGYYYEVRCNGCGKVRNLWHYNVMRTSGCRSCSQVKGNIRATIGGKVTKEYTAYKSMVARCQLTMPSWIERYAGTSYEGMEIDPDWLGPEGYQNFYRDLGPSPDGFYLDREDNNRGYVKGNVRWVSVTESNRNKGNTRWITAFGVTQPVSDWADDLGITAEAILRRIDVMGWSEEDAVSKRPTGPRPDNDLYYIQIAAKVALRSTCARRAVGCVLVDQNNYVLSTGYNSSPSGTFHCTEVACDGATAKSGEALHLCQSRHAEDVALTKCRDIHGIKTAYVTTSPCIGCVRRLIDTSCQRIVYVEDYPGCEASQSLWESLGRSWYRMPS